MTDALDRVEAAEAGPGEIVAVAGIPEVTIGETLADPDDPRPLPVEQVDEPSLSMTVGINTSPLAGLEGSQADREPGEGPPRRRARRERLAARAAHGAAGHLGGAGPRRASARGARRADAAGRLRAHGRQAPGGDARARRQGARARRAARDRRTRGVHRRAHAAPRAAQGPDGADGQPRHRLGAARIPRAGAWTDRVPDGVPHRDPRYRDPAPRLRSLRAVVRRAAHAGRAARWSQTGKARRPASRSRTCRSGEPCSSARASASTRG